MNTLKSRLRYKMNAFRYRLCLQINKEDEKFFSMQTIETAKIKAKFKHRFNFHRKINLYTFNLHMYLSSQIFIIGLNDKIYLKI